MGLLVALPLLFAGCNKEKSALSSLTRTGQTANSVTSFSISEVREWYMAQLTATNKYDLNQFMTFDWEAASETATDEGPLLLVPIHDSYDMFKENKYQGYRRLLVRQQDGKLQAQVAELLVEGKADAEVLTEVFTRTAPTGGEPAKLNNPLSGYVFWYDKYYEYLNGTGYTSGVPTTTGAKLAVIRSGVCIEYYLASDGSYITTICGGDVGTGGTGLGGDDHSGSGANYNPLPNHGQTSGWSGGAGSSPLTGMPAVLARYDANIDDSQLAPCLSIVLSQLKGLTPGQIGIIIMQFAGHKPGYNWTMVNAAGGLPVGTAGATSQSFDPQTGIVYTRFDVGQLGDATNLFLAQLVMHEAVHAYLVAYLNNDPASYGQDYPQLADIYRRNGNMNAAQHDQMVTSFINGIAAALMQYGQSQGYNLSAQFYHDLAWGGLAGNRGTGTGVNAFNQLPFSERDRIRTVLSREFSGKNPDGSAGQQQGGRMGCQ